MDLPPPGVDTGRDSQDISDPITFPRIFGLMTAYVIAQFTVTNAEGFEAYRRAAPPIVEAFGGRVLVHGGTIASIEGEIDRQRMFVLEFPDKNAAERFYNSPEYQEVLPLRRNNTVGTVSIVEGGL